MNTVRFTLMALCFAIGVSSCKTTTKVTQDEIIKHDSLYIETRIVDTLIQVAPDTATARLLIECDEHNNALVSIIDQMTGERANLTPIIEYINVTDTTGMVRRDALVTMQAIAEGFATRVNILEQIIKESNDEKANLQTELQKKSHNMINWLIAGFFIGAIAVCLLAFIITKYMK